MRMSPAMRISQPTPGIAEEVLLGQPLHLPRQMGDQQDVDEALVVGDDDVRPARVGDERAGRAEPPQRVEQLVDDGELAEQQAGGVAAAVERRGDERDQQDVQYTGEVQSFIEEHAALIADLELSTLIVIFLVTGAMLAFYRDWRATLALVVSLFCGTFWTFGASYFAVGYLNANSAFLGSIVIGNGINFGIILLARYMEERRRNREHVEAVDIAMRTTATSTWTAALAAGLSYGSLWLTRFRGFRQFGIIGLIGMVLCWISSFTLLPAFLALLDRWAPRKNGKVTGTESGGKVAGLLANSIEMHARPLCWGAGMLTFAAVCTFPRYSPNIIETDLNHLRNKTSMEHGAGFYDKDLIDIFHRYLSPIVIMPKDREHAEKIEALLLKKKEQEGEKSEMATIQTLQDFVPTDQPAKILILKDMKSSLTPQILQNLEGEEKSWVKEYLTDEAMVPFVENDLPPLVLSKFTEKDGTRGKLVLVEPPLKDGINLVSWDGRALISFIHELRTIADSVAPGTPVAGQLPISADLIESISEDGPKATFFAFLAVVLLVVILFREPKTIALTLFSLLLGITWLAGLILGFGWKINFLNFIALPITFGIGVDYGVNIFQRYRLEGKGRIVPVVRHAGGAVMLASLTTIIGYSSLLIAENQAFVSFGRLAVLGEICCVVAAVVALPAFLLARHHRELGLSQRPSPKQKVSSEPGVSTAD